LKCDAQFSCADSSIWMQNSLDCRGVGSCQDSKIEFVANVETENIHFLECAGRHSCTNAAISGVKDVHCVGGGSCLNAFMSLDGELQLIGAQAAANAIITGASDIIASGFMSMAFATVSSSGHDVCVTASGHLAGYGATFECGPNDNCELHCEGAACQSLEFVCELGANCNVVPGECLGGVGSSGGIVCPEIIFDSSDSERDFSNDLMWKYVQERMMADASTDVTVDTAQFHEDIGLIQQKGQWWRLSKAMALMTLVAMGLIVSIALYKSRTTKQSEEYQPLL